MFVSRWFLADIYKNKADSNKNIADSYKNYTYNYKKKEEFR